MKKAFSTDMFCNARRVALIAALQEEISPLLRTLRPQEKIKTTGKRFYKAKIAGRDLLLVRAAMGGRNAVEALHFIQNNFKPDLVINLGFAGALSPNLHIGDVISVTKYIAWPNILHEDYSIIIQHSFSASLFSEKAKVTLFRGTCLTCPEPYRKEKFANLSILEGENVIMDMEGFFYAEICQKMGIPFVSLKGVTDTYEEELKFNLDDLCNEYKDVDPVRAILMLIKYPQLIPHFWKLWRYSTKAASNLRNVVIFMLSQ